MLSVRVIINSNGETKICVFLLCRDEVRKQIPHRVTQKEILCNENDIGKPYETQLVL